MSCIPAVCDLSQKRWKGRVYKCMHERTNHSVLYHRVEQYKRGGRTLPTPRQITPCLSVYIFYIFGGQMVHKGAARLGFSGNFVSNCGKGRQIVMRNG